MTRPEFDKWLEKKHPALGVMARNIDKTNGEDLLHTTIEYVLSHKLYMKVNRGAMYWFAKILKGTYNNQLKHLMVQQKYSELEVPCPLGFDPSKLLEDKIYLKELWPKFATATRMFLSAIAAGNTAKEAYAYSYKSLTLSYSAYLKFIKTDIEWVVKH